METVILTPLAMHSIQALRKNKLDELGLPDKELPMRFKPKKDGGLEVVLLMDDKPNLKLLIAEEHWHVQH